MDATKLSEVEDIYEPFKEKRKKIQILKKH